MNSKISVRGTTSYSWGILCGYCGASQMKIASSQISASSSGASFGAFGDSGSLVVNNSELTGATNTVYGFATVRIGASWLNGGPAFGTCAGVYDENYVFTAGPVCP